ncbi:DUF397 domain-containing protein [Streptomyces sp. NPDC005899]|uniref:DUF397 domain-containing protein n=1 Tax=Streptomyces sp. NPDC005899 TaxID=3155716 RepID=UPI0033FC89F1
MTVPTWQTSSYCAQGEACIHIGTSKGSIVLTESGDPSGTILRTTPTALAALLRSVKEGRDHG